MDDDGESYVEPRAAWGVTWRTESYGARMDDVGASYVEPRPVWVTDGGTASYGDRIADVAVSYVEAPIAPPARPVVWYTFVPTLPTVSYCGTCETVWYGDDDGEADIFWRDRDADLDRGGRTGAPSAVETGTDVGYEVGARLEADCRARERRTTTAATMIQRRTTTTAKIAGMRAPVDDPAPSPASLSFCEAGWFPSDTNSVGTVSCVTSVHSAEGHDSGASVTATQTPAPSPPCRLCSWDGLVGQNDKHEPDPPLSDSQKAWPCALYLNDSHEPAFVQQHEYGSRLNERHRLHWSIEEHSKLGGGGAVGCFVGGLGVGVGFGVGGCVGFGVGGGVGFVVGGGVGFGVGGGVGFDVGCAVATFGVGCGVACSVGCDVGGVVCGPATVLVDAPLTPTRVTPVVDPPVTRSDEPSVVSVSASVVLSWDSAPQYRQSLRALHSVHEEIDEQAGTSAEVAEMAHKKKMNSRKHFIRSWDRRGGGGGGGGAGGGGWGGGGG
jgi:hypothetical protein